ncbi:MAG TPA: MerR family transcriptional regulator [Anaeromyxobacter sp.]|nr:MerR family transcriptional regulator [Anaeromyxobacter sp.]
MRENLSARGRLGIHVASVAVELQACYPTCVERNGFGVAAVLRLTHVSYRNLDYWARTGLVRSSIKQAAGKGSRRVYAFEDLVALRLVGRLRQAGIPLQAIRRAVRYLQAHAGKPLSTLGLVADGRRILATAYHPKKMIDATAEGQVVIAVDIAPIRRRLEADVSELGADRDISVRARGRSYRVVLSPDLEAGGYAISVPELPGCFSEADDAREAVRMAREAIELWLDTEADLRKSKGGRAAQR